MDQFKNLKLQTFTKENIEQFVQFAFDSFIFGNQDFPKTANAKQTFSKRSRIQATTAIEAAERVNAKLGTTTKYNTFIRKDGRMICASFSCEAHYFFKEIVPTNDEFFMYRKLPIQQILQECKQYTGVVGLRTIIKKEYQGLRIYNFLLTQRKKIYEQNGISYSYGITFNPKIIGFVNKYGGEIICTFSQFIIDKTIEFSLIKYTTANLFKTNSSSL